MKKLILPLIMSVLLGCQDKSRVLYENKDYSVFTDKVIQGDFLAQVLPDGSISSNYKSSENEPPKRAIEIKFSINQKDNELPFATNHKIVVKPIAGKYTTPLITFGEQFVDVNSDADETLELNTNLTVKLDMRHVFKSFEEKGYFVNYNGEKIYRDDFKGVFIAGNIVPLNFDFENLGGDVQLNDLDGDLIFETTLVINTYDSDRYVKPSWKLTADISKYPSLKTNNALLQSLYNMALEETVLLSEDDGTFRTGAKWAGVWTRDISYAIVLGMGIADAERAKKSLLRKTNRNRIIQDTGSGGAWPVSSDRTTWALAAWEIYLITGEELWLDYCYQVISQTVEDDRKVVYNPKFGLYRGESSFLDWRVQTYPSWMDNADIYSSMNLGTNIVHYQTLVILTQIAELVNLPEQSKKYSTWASELKTSINKHFWNQEKGYYSQFLYGRNFMYLSTKSETLGEAFSILFNIADDKAKTVIENTPVVNWGTPCAYPQIPNIRPYHNNGIWPFVQAYWNIAAAKTGNTKVLEHGLASLYRAAGLFLTNKENMVAENGDFITALNSDRQLWSVAGNLAMVYKVFFGISFSPDQTIQFNPVIPKAYNGKMVLDNLKIRDKEFKIKIKGYGNQIESFKIDGIVSNNYQASLGGKGKHTIEIIMANNEMSGKINLVENKFHLKTPKASINDNYLSWSAIEDAEQYKVYKNGQLWQTINDTKIKLLKGNSEYAVIAFNSNNTSSFISKPIPYSSSNIEVNLFKYTKYRGYSNSSYPNGMIELSKRKNREIEWSVNIPENGKYNLYFEYTNGNGPWNTDNKCAIRTLWVNNVKTNAVVMPQRGVNEWANIGHTNIINCELTKGTNHFKLSFEPENENMNIENNKALLGKLFLMKI